jgi:SAM-dependent methyltransferase
MNRLPDAYFDKVYSQGDDPWGFATRWYERRKYALTLAALPQERYERAFEPGCSNGVLSELLAPRCGELLASELVPAVAERARQRLQRFGHVRVDTAAIPESWPSGSFDLLLLSEVLYYLSESGAATLLACARESLREGAHLLAVHYRRATDYPMTGDAAHALLRTCTWLRPLARYEEELFVLELFERDKS